MQFILPLTIILLMLCFVLAIIRIISSNQKVTQPNVTQDTQRLISVEELAIGQSIEKECKVEDKLRPIKVRIDKIRENVFSCYEIDPYDYYKAINAREIPLIELLRLLERKEISKEGWTIVQEA